MDGLSRPDASPFLINARFSKLSSPSPVPSDINPIELRLPVHSSHLPSATLLEVLNVISHLLFGRSTRQNGDVKSVRCGSRRSVGERPHASIPRISRRQSKSASFAR